MCRPKTFNMSVTKNFFQILAVQFLLFQSTNHISLVGLRLIEFFSLFRIFVFIPSQMRQRYYKFEQFGACDGYPTNIGKVEKFLVTQPSKNQYYVDGEFSFFKNITAPIKLHIRSIRCSLQDDSRCIHNDGLQFYVCDHLNDENALWSPFIKSISPKLMCPIRMVRKITNFFIHSYVDYCPVAGNV